MQSGEILRAGKLAYKTYGEISPRGDNAILLQTDNKIEARLMAGMHKTYRWLETLDQSLEQ